MKNCKNCLYGNLNEDLSIECDKKYPLTGKTIHIEVDKVDKLCPAHDSFRLEEWRYDRGNKFLDEAEDVCSCGRMIDLNNNNAYQVIGNSLFCKLCINEINIADNEVGI